MKSTFLSFLTSAAIIATSCNSFAQVALKSEETTIMHNLKELKDNLKETAKFGIANFDNKLSTLYDDLSMQVDNIENKFKDKKEAVVDTLREKRDNAGQAIEDYKNATPDKAEEMRVIAVDKLENLNEVVENYNKNPKK